MDMKAWIVSANMGLGHQRATYPLRNMAHHGVLLFGEDEVATKKKKRQWTIFRNTYETLSRTSQIPLIGPYLFSLLEKKCRTFPGIIPGGTNPVRRCR